MLRWESALGRRLLIAYANALLLQLHHLEAAAAAPAAPAAPCYLDLYCWLCYILDTAAAAAIWALHYYVVICIGYNYRQHVITLISPLLVAEKWFHFFAYAFAHFLHVFRCITIRNSEDDKHRFFWLLFNMLSLVGRLI